MAQRRLVILDRDGTLILPSGPFTWGFEGNDNV